MVRDIQNSQCLLNVEYSGPSCPHVTIQFGDTKDDVGLGLVKEGLVMVDIRKEKYLQKMVGGAHAAPSQLAPGSCLFGIFFHRFPVPALDVCSAVAKYHCFYLLFPTLSSLDALVGRTVRIDNPAVHHRWCPSISGGLARSSANV